MWDLGNLQSKLNDMQFAIAAADEALITKDPYGSQGFENTQNGGGDGMVGGDYETDGTSHGFDLATLPTDEYGNYLPVDPISMVDASVLPISEGYLHKESSSMLARGWKQRWVRLEGAELAFYGRADERKPRNRFSLDAKTTVEPGDTVKPNRRDTGVKFDLLLSNASGSRLHVYAESEEEATAWMQSLSYVVHRLGEAARLNDLIAAGALPPPPPPGGNNGRAGSGGGGYDGGSTLNGGMGGAGVGELLGLGGSLGGNNGYGNNSGGISEQDSQRLADDASAHAAYGSGLYEGVRGEPATFFIQAHDAPGVPRGVGGDIFTVSLDSDDLHFELVPVDNGDGTYTVEYTPTRSGTYRLSVTYGGHDIFGSPFQPEVSSAPTAASHCVASGPGMTVAQVGHTNEFDLTARDQFDEPRGTGGDSFEVTILGPGLANPIVDNGDGSYSVSYDVDTEARAYAAALEEGRALTLEIHITLANEGFPYPRPIAGSPFRPRVAMPGSAAAAAFMPGSAPAVATQQQQQPSPGGATSPTGPGASPSPSAAGFSAPAPPSAAASAAASAALDEREAEIARARSELEAKERSLAEALASVESMRASVEADRAAVDRQMTRMAELGRKVKEDSERLAEQARALRSVATAGIPQQQQQQHYGGGGSPLPHHHHHHPSGTVGGRSPMTALGEPASPPAPPAPQASVGHLRFGGGDGGSIATAGTSATAVAAAAAMAAARAAILGSPQAAGGGSPSGGDANSGNNDSESLFDPEVLSLFDRHKKPLFQLFQHYAALTAAAAALAAGDGEDGGASPASPAGTGVDAKRFVELFIDFDVAPTFLTRKELKAIFGATAAAHAYASESPSESSGERLSYAGFIEALGRAALGALGKPAFTHLYPSARDKVGVLLEMWSVADPRKLLEVARRPRPAPGAAKRRA